MITRPFSRVLPHNQSDIACFLLLAIFMPLTYISEMTIILPEIHDVGSLFYIFTWLAGMFLIFNLVSNMLSCMIVDSSIRIKLLKLPTKPELRRLWHKCEECQALVPPRAWHCDICKICTLKRDHHCKFIGCCVGHYNQRYFFYLLIYLFIGSTYATVYNSIYMWYLHGDYYMTQNTVIKMVLPLLIFTLDLSWASFFILIYDLNIICMLLSGALIVYHMPTITCGTVAHERGSRKYDLGLKRNLEMVLGKRMHLTWISPFIKSELPHDGIDWQPAKIR